MLLGMPVPFPIERERGEIVAAFSVNVGFLSEEGTIGKTAGQENGSQSERWAGGSRQSDVCLPVADSC